MFNDYTYPNCITLLHVYILRTCNIIPVFVFAYNIIFGIRNLQIIAFDSCLLTSDMSSSLKLVVAKHLKQLYALCYVTELTVYGLISHATTCTTFTPMWYPFYKMTNMMFFTKQMLIINNKYINLHIHVT